MADYARSFGPIANRKYDMGTQVATAVQQGAQNFRCVRVTDGTDVAASIAVQSTCITFTALYTGTLGNSITIQIANGSKANTYKAIVGLPGLQPEVFDNIGGSANAFWVNLANAINNGNGPLRGPSALVAATAGAGTAAPTLATVALTGGTDGVGTISASTLVGSDTTPRKGLYALREQGCSIGLLADADDNTQWAAQVAFGLSEGIYMILTGPAGDTISNAVSVRNTAGIDSYAAKLMHGDWCYWSDATNQVIRLVSPQGFAAGRLANLSPEQSPLNKPVYGVIGTQKTGLPSAQSTTYSAAELQTLFAAGIDVITNPAPGGAYFTTRLGHNTSSNAAINGDNYTRLTNYIASTLSNGMGVYIGELINANLFQRIRATLMSYLGNLLQQGQLGSTDGSLPYSVICDLSNNPPSRTALGYCQADVQIRYQAINEKFIVNMEGGQTVTIQRQTLAPSSLPATPVI
jgi:phage tail sheath protein FI